MVKFLSVFGIGLHVNAGTVYGLLCYLVVSVFGGVVNHYIIAGSVIHLSPTNQSSVLGKVCRLLQNGEGIGICLKLNACLGFLGYRHFISASNLYHGIVVKDISPLRLHGNGIGIGLLGRALILSVNGKSGNLVAAVHSHSLRLGISLTGLQLQIFTGADVDLHTAYRLILRKCRNAP